MNPPRCLQPLANMWVCLNSSVKDTLLNLGTKQEERKKKKNMS